MLHIDPRPSCPRLRFRIALRVRVSQSGNSIKSAAQLSWNEPNWAFSPLVQNPSNKRKSRHCRTMLSQNLLSFLNCHRDFTFVFRLIASFHLSFSSRFPAKLTLQRYLTGRANNRLYVGPLEDKGAASHVAALILYKAQRARAHAHILDAVKELKLSASACSLTNGLCDCKAWSGQNHVENNLDNSFTN